MIIWQQKNRNRFCFLSKWSEFKDIENYKKKISAVSYVLKSLRTLLQKPNLVLFQTINSRDKIV